MKPQYYVVSATDSFKIVSIFNNYCDAYCEADHRTRSYGNKHKVLKEVCDFDKSDLVVTQYDEF